ncbi:MAG: serine hydrolase domain-containing protein [Terriglobales bacterium]
MTRSLDPPVPRLLSDAIAARAFPGCSLAVEFRGELTTHALGRFTYEPDSPAVTSDTIYDLASLTKVLATTPMAMLLYQRGLLDLDMPVASVLREFSGSDTRRDRVTFRMLLAHTSGLPGYAPLFKTCGTRDELLSAALRLPLASDPGERTDYSDIGFIILGEALARIADEPLDSFCRREIFGPLGLARTTFNPPPTWHAQIPPTEDDRTFRHRILQGEVHDENAGVLGGVAGHAGLFSTALDVITFARAILSNHAGARSPSHATDRDVLAPPPSAGKLFLPATIYTFAQPHPSRSGSPRALGFDLPSSPSQSGKHFSPHSLGHLGFTGTSLWLDPERSLAVALLTNRTWPDRHSDEIKRLRPRLHDAIVESLLSRNRRKEN